ncbi:MAG: NADPH:quinone oxidoreductase family protein [Acidimicrobiales bacterium]
MKAIVCRQFGGPEVLELADVAEPAAGEGQVVVDVRACAVTFPDLLIMHDLYQYKPGLPYIPGGEVAGVVRSVGLGVHQFDAGDLVMGSAGSVGGFAERVALPASHVSAVPDGSPLEEAAGLLYAYGTSHHALRDRAALRPGETLLVLGAAGGVGLAAVELGRLMGARVIAAASSDDKLELCKQRGADETINYSRDDLKTAARALTGGAGADVVYDPVGGKYAEPALRATAWQGRYLVIGFTAGEIPRLPTNLALLRGCSIVGVYWGSFIQRQPEDNRRNVAELTEWWRAGRLKPYVSAIYPLERAPDALRDLAARRTVGKVVVTVG